MKRQSKTTRHYHIRRVKSGYTPVRQHLMHYWKSVGVNKWKGKRGEMMSIVQHQPAKLFPTKRDIVVVMPEGNIKRDYYFGITEAKKRVMEAMKKDSDGDGVPDIVDCQPSNPKYQEVGTGTGASIGAPIGAESHAGVSIGSSDLPITGLHAPSAGDVAEGIGSLIGKAVGSVGRGAVGVVKGTVSELKEAEKKKVERETKKVEERIEAEQARVKLEAKKRELEQVRRQAGDVPLTEKIVTGVKKTIGGLSKEEQVLEKGIEEFKARRGKAEEAEVSRLEMRVREKELRKQLKELSRKPPKPEIVEGEVEMPMRPRGERRSRAQRKLEKLQTQLETKRIQAELRELSAKKQGTTPEGVPIRRKKRKSTKLQGFFGLKI